jgi:hypothetical protein
MIDSVSKDTVCVVLGCIVSKNKELMGAAMKFAKAIKSANICSSC